MGVETSMHDLENPDNDAAISTQENETNTEFARGDKTSQMTKHHLSSSIPFI